MLIGNGKAEDTKEITTYLMLAMKDIVYDFIGEKYT